MQDIRELYQEVILDHNQNPRNFGPLESANREAEGFNPLCGDQLKLYADIENDAIKDIHFDGSGCAIFKASSSIMTELAKGKSVEEADTLFDQFHELVTTGSADAESLGKLAVMAGVHQYPARVKCASLAWHTLKNILDGSNETVTTE
ncbi:MAG: SUF system NifU family Fe-S cluster assembly protein [Candidatus Marinimicrobia bacterium]|mgnify:FL=1|nr:SUF system NifU family Fe-S cluster assembly protein [Candidatus Neomarinimicrobiota bacterium]MDP6790158.1 SUF system NifU family Fe-S cluster assembly protein [Candidatus Neomarinimicrobiota bacterium]MDP7071794.1 SUF system NifU family Fe-S cluster assembly protein [Candidatus Neomarinimicrobiota bacterium]